MKLYTKEMFLQAAKKCEVSMIDAKHIMKYIDEYVTPIELPSDKEIEKWVLSTGYYGHCTGEYLFEQAKKMEKDKERQKLIGLLDWMNKVAADNPMAFETDHDDIVDMYLNGYYNG